MTCRSFIAQNVKGHKEIKHFNFYQGHNNLSLKPTIYKRKTKNTKRTSLTLDIPRVKILPTLGETSFISAAPKL